MCNILRKVWLICLMSICVLFSGCGEKEEIIHGRYVDMETLYFMLDSNSHMDDCTLSYDGKTKTITIKLNDVEDEVLCNLSIKIFENNLELLSEDKDEQLHSYTCHFTYKITEEISYKDICTEFIKAISDYKVNISINDGFVKRNWE